MILTNCAACAAPLAHNAPRCVRCWTRYCDSTCQHDHWRRGHKQMCKKIHRGGNAEQYNADKKYKEAVAEAVEACAEDTKGQKCYICLEAVHPRTGEGLVRGCACGDRDGVSSPELGVAHVSCLARQAKILYEEARENNLGEEASNNSWDRWHTCGLCKQKYHGVVSCALGWACWKTYVGRPEGDRLRIWAMTELGNGLYATRNYEDAASVWEAESSVLRRFGGSAHDVLMTQGNLANSYQMLERLDETLRMRKEVYAGTLRLVGPEHKGTLSEAFNYATSLIKLNNLEKAKELLRKTIPVARRVLGESNEITLRMRCTVAIVLYNDPGATLDDLREAATTLEETIQISRQTFGSAHPLVVDMEGRLHDLRDAVAAFLLT